MVKAAFLITASVGLARIAEGFVAQLSTRSLTSRMVRNRQILMSTTEEKTESETKIIENLDNSVVDILEVELSGLDEWMVKMGIKDDPRVRRMSKLRAVILSTL